MSEERTKTSSICIVFLKVLVITIVVLSTVYFCVWTYQSIKRLEARDECFEGKLYSLGLIERPERLKGDHGDLIEDNTRARVKKDVVSRPPQYKGNKGARGAPGLPGRAGYKGQKGEQGVCSCDPPPPPTLKPTLGPRLFDCRITMFGIPLHLADSVHAEGSFTRDMHRKINKEDRYFVTFGSNTTRVQLYENLNDFRNNQTVFYYDLPDDLQGTEYIVHNGSLYYHVTNTNKIHKLDLSTERVSAVARFHRASYRGDMKLFPYGNNYFDIAYDGNGLWVFYKKRDVLDVLVVAQLTLQSLEVVLTWEIELEGRTFGNLMVVCGNVYLIRHANVIGSCVENVYDLYTKRWSDVSMVFKVPYSHLTMLQYDPFETKAYSWDNGNLLEYMMLFT